MSSSTSFYIFICLASFMIIYCNALQCYQCGQYNDGVGSITPCLNYTANLAHLHLKECARKSDKYCIVSILELHSQIWWFPHGVWAIALNHSHPRRRRNQSFFANSHTDCFAAYLRFGLRDNQLYGCATI